MRIAIGRLLIYVIPVSYTHLNKTYNRIRKRDVIDTPKTENSVRTIDIPNFLKEEVQAVSYTHLDVYKRQMYTCMIQGQESHLFYEVDKWFMERKTA